MVREKRLQGGGERGIQVTQSKEVKLDKLTFIVWNLYNQKNLSRVPKTKYYKIVIKLEQMLWGRDYRIHEHGIISKNGKKDAKNNTWPEKGVGKILIN